MKDKFAWDHYSDQPYQLKDRAYKKAMKKKHRKDLLPLLAFNLFFFPLGILVAFFYKGQPQPRERFFALCVNLDKGEEQAGLVKELDCSNIQIRMPLADIGKLQQYVDFSQKFNDCHVLINILQDRDNIQDHQLLTNNIRAIFSAFKGRSALFQIGNAINRTKWGFFSVDEYLKFYQCVQAIRDDEFPEIELVGPAVIDYEYHFTIRALFNRFSLKFDKLAALLYVDRRGAPENAQTGIFNTTRKIDFLYALCKLSPKTSSDILITEANWPLSNTAPWAPTSETECVNEEDYANFMLRYYLLAFASGKVESVYWHQLIASGYGLIDARDGLRKRSAFYVFKTMLIYLQGSLVESYNYTAGRHRLVCVKGTDKIEVLWNHQEEQLFSSEKQVFNKLGGPIEGDIYIGASPIYILH